MLMSFIRRPVHNALKTSAPVGNHQWRRGTNNKFAIAFTIALILSAHTTAANMPHRGQLSAQQDFARKSAQFAVNLFNFIYHKEPQNNIIYSPFSIQTCVSMARMGATGETAAELDRGLGLPLNNEAAIANTFHNILADYVNSPILKIANKIYIMDTYKVQQEFNEIATTKFFSSAENINFANSEGAANTINKWVESKTNNLIKDLIPPAALSGETRIVLVNAIHFKGEWKHQFPKEATRDDNFYLNEVDSVRVPMMNLKATFGFTYLHDLDASVLEMPYKDSDLSMLVILPSSRTGLATLHEKLKSFDLSEITQRLTPTKVMVKFPKFKAEFEIELKEALENLGMKRMFSRDAEFGKMLDSDERLQVSKVIHKAFIEVNEEGTEAAAATAMTVMYCSFVAHQPPRFSADHPFIYLIRSGTHGQPLFVGEFVKP
ncbi:serine protease inhibitor 42Dd-like isoform X4 [Anastrepha ludens]|uniref:serine protease inhibitor 42Dd-like isoform X4 n=1 Tax=Anastrepha ludens TaxID=28586 RepID=UPI0023B0B7D5|nr:serine protease inhibitor 42Dd-like isoform X4 [Anastrepha ludens]